MEKRGAVYALRDIAMITAILAGVSILLHQKTHSRPKL